MFSPTDSSDPISRFSTPGTVANAVSLKDRSAFIHEMAQIWQNQRNIRYDAPRYTNDQCQTHIPLHREMDTDWRTGGIRNDTIWQFPDRFDRGGYVVEQRAETILQVGSVGINPFRARSGRSPIIAAKIAERRDANRHYNYMGYDLYTENFEQFGKEEEADIRARAINRGIASAAQL